MVEGTFASAVALPSAPAVTGEPMPGMLPSGVNATTTGASFVPQAPLWMCQACSPSGTFVKCALTRNALGSPSTGKTWISPVTLLVPSGWAVTVMRGVAGIGAGVVTGGAASVVGAASVLAASSVLSRLHAG